MTTPAQRQFLNELREEAREVPGSKHSLWLNALSRWFDVIDSDASAREAVHALESRVDFDTWHKAQEDAMEGETGRLRFPRDRQESLGIRLRMFRLILDDKFDTLNFGLNFLDVSNQDDIVWAMSQAIFSPMARDLDKYLTDYFEAIDKNAPAADRIVSLDHNSAAYKEVLEKADQLREALLRTNIHIDDKERHIAELSAGITLLSSLRISVAAVKETLLKAGQSIAEKVMDHAIEIIAAGLVSAVLTLIGLG